MNPADTNNVTRGEQPAGKSRSARSRPAREQSSGGNTRASSGLWPRRFRVAIAGLAAPSVAAACDPAGQGTGDVRRGARATGVLKTNILMINEKRQSLPRQRRFAAI
jgi:hypothetical protein